MKITRRSLFWAPAVLPLVLLTQGCGAISINTILSIIELIAQGISTVAGGLLTISPLTLATTIETWANTINTAAQQALTLLSGAVNVQSVASAIIALFNNIVAPVLTGLTAAMVTAIDNVGKDIANIISDLTSVQSASPAKVQAAQKRAAAMSSTMAAKTEGILASNAILLKNFKMLHAMGSFIETVEIGVGQ